MTLLLLPFHTPLHKTSLHPCESRSSIMDRLCLCCIYAEYAVIMLNMLCLCSDMLRLCTEHIQHKIARLMLGDNNCPMSARPCLLGTYFRAGRLHIFSIKLLGHSINLLRDSIKLLRLALTAAYGHSDSMTIGTQSFRSGGT